MDNRRIDLLEDYIRRINEGEDGWKLYHAYQAEITSITPEETVALMNGRLTKGESVAAILENLEKFMHVFSRSHKRFVIATFDQDGFLGCLSRENEMLKQKLDELRTIIMHRDYQSDRQTFKSFLLELIAFNAHYLKKENLLFPVLETKEEHFAGLKIMWALHDAIRSQIKACTALFATDILDTTEIDRQLGMLYFALYGCIDKEERILFPLAMESLTSDEMKSLFSESFEYGFPFIDAPQKPRSPKLDSLPDGVFKTETGSLTNTEILAVFSALPVDLTFVDADDKVRFFSKPKDRIFPRTPAILGRDVRHCHPPDSVHVVLDIIDSFRKGSQESATFWIQMGANFILIQYFALRDGDHHYLGTLEVSQNVTEIRGLEGQRRILSWETEK
jgi:uncharacterized protein